MTVTNEYTDTNAGEYQMLWSLQRDGTILESGEIADVDIAPLTSAEITIPYTIPEDAQIGDEFFLNVSFVTKTATSWCEAGHEVAKEQFELVFDGMDADRALDTEDMESFADGALQETDTEVTISQDNWSVSFDKETGALSSFQSDGKEMVAEGLLPNYWRAYTDNDAKESVDANWKKANDGAVVENVQVTESDKVIYVTVDPELLGFQGQPDLYRLLIGRCDREEHPRPGDRHGRALKSGQQDPAGRKPGEHDLVRQGRVGQLQ